MNCLICNSSDIETKDTVVSDFVMARICETFRPGENYNTKLCFCKRCTFAYYDYRLSEEEEYRLYNNYRDEKYQKTRERFECWYTKKVNQILNSDEIALDEQRKQITSMLFDHSDREIKIALDYGGNEGKTFTPAIGTTKKYVYDISGVHPIKGITLITNQEELKKNNYDFIMCNMLFEHLAYPIDAIKTIAELGDQHTLFYIEVPSENPFIKGAKFSITKNIKLAVNQNYSLVRLIRYYIKSSQSYFMPMKEHINFFTKKSLEKMIEMNNLKVIDIRESFRNSRLGTSEVLSVLFQKSS